MTTPTNPSAGEKASYTQTPWNYIVGKTLIHIETDASNRAGAGIHLCSLPKHKEANAAHIVHCVNLHDELVAALEALVTAFDADIDRIPGRDLLEWLLAHRESLSRARKALNRAKQIQ